MIDVAAIARTAFAVAGNATGIVKALLYRSFTNQAYDPAAGTVAKTEVNTPINAIYQEFDVKEVNNETVRLGDRKVLVRSEELAALPTLSLDDKIIDGAITWEIIGRTMDPTGTINLFHVRARTQ
jgi:hypothetical protein